MEENGKAKTAKMKWSEPSLIELSGAKSKIAEGGPVVCDSGGSAANCTFGGTAGECFTGYTAQACLTGLDAQV